MERTLARFQDLEKDIETEDTVEKKTEEQRVERYPLEQAILTSWWWEREGSLSDKQAEPAVPSAESSRPPLLPGSSTTSYPDTQPGHPE